MLNVLLLPIRLVEVVSCIPSPIFEHLKSAIWPFKVRLIGSSGSSYRMDVAKY